MRITVGGQRADMSMHRAVEPDKWDQAKGRINSNAPWARELNDYLNEKYLKAHNIRKNLEEKDQPVTAIAVRNALQGISEEKTGVLEVFDDHNRKCAELVGKDFAPATVKRYETTRSHLAEYILFKYKEKDVALKSVHHVFITGFEHFLKTKHKCNHNTSVKYVRNFRKIINLALKNDWISKDPFRNIHNRMQRVDRDYLTKAELETMRKREFNNERLSKVRDIFVFCCFTGLAFSDVKRLSRDHLQESIDGSKGIVIKINRVKTDTPCRIPLMSIPMEIIEKYKEDPFCQKYGVLLPLPSNQKMNAYLKEIADRCGINKNLSTHIARHTFATTVTLANGIPIEIVSKMLGHSNITTTEIYAKILNASIDKEMSKLDKLYSADIAEDGII